MKSEMPTEERRAATFSCPEERKHRLEDLLRRAQGALLGLACGDALGTTLEFTQPGSFSPVSTIVGGGPFKLPAGAWTDDTSMALCLAESLVECASFDPADQCRRYLRWASEGYRSSIGSCFDIGTTTGEALAKYRETGNPFSGSNREWSAGNGSLMRLAPVSIRYSQSPEDAIRLSGESSRTTHQEPRAVDACRYFGGLVAGAMNGIPKDQLLSAMYRPNGTWAEEELHPAVAEVARGSFVHKEPPAIRGGGYVIQALEAALWAFARTESFKDGALLAVNLGEDADTTGAIYGQLAGAHYGLDGIPGEWASVVFQRDLILRLASLLVLSIPETAATLERPGAEWLELHYGAKFTVADLPGIESSASGSDRVAEVICHPQDHGVLGLRNLSRMTWQAVLPSGRTVEVPPGKSLRISPGTTLQWKSEPPLPT
jgi:ADP-ribosyl-[dinitrogen reductase] hydrolase